jgi:hypothetical protein
MDRHGDLSKIGADRRGAAVAAEVRALGSHTYTDRNPKASGCRNIIQHSRGGEFSYYLIAV